MYTVIDFQFISKTFFKILTSAGIHPALIYFLGIFPVAFSTFFCDRGFSNWSPN